METMEQQLLQMQQQMAEMGARIMEQSEQMLRQQAEIAKQQAELTELRRAIGPGGDWWTLGISQAAFVFWSQGRLGTVEACFLGETVPYLQEVWCSRLLVEGF